VRKQMYKSWQRWSKSLDWNSSNDPMKTAHFSDQTTAYYLKSSAWNIPCKQRRIVLTWKLQICLTSFHQTGSKQRIT